MFPTWCVTLVHSSRSHLSLSPPESVTWDFSASGQRPFIANCSTSATDSATVEPVCIPVHEFFLGPKCAELIHRVAMLSCSFAVSKNLYVTSIVLGWIGFILNSAIFLLYLLNPMLRKWPGHCIVALAAVLFCSLLLTTSLSEHTVASCVCFCSDDEHIRRSQGPVM